MRDEHLQGWPDYWPPPDVFFGPLAANIAGLHTSAQIMEQQVIVKFKNRYGVRISQSNLHKGLYVVAPLKFQGSQPDQYECAHDAVVPGQIWCFTSDEVFTICQDVARWQRQELCLPEGGMALP